MTCINARDTITQSAGGAVDNSVLYDAVVAVSGGVSAPVITSHCRQGDGIWVAYYFPVLGDGISTIGHAAYGDSQDKGEWPSIIASTTNIGVTYFPDDGSPSTTYTFATLPIYSWNKIGGWPPTNPCAVYPFIGDSYANNLKAQLAGWTMAVIDVQVRTDGTNVWVVVLAREATIYPYLWSNKMTIDNCFVHHPNFEDMPAIDPFAWDTDYVDRDDLKWYYAPGQLGPEHRWGDYDDTGYNHSLQWYPARVTVWGGDLGGFSKIDTIEAVYDNVNDFGASGGGGLCGPIEACASPAQPGVLHVMWAEAGGYYFTGDPVSHPPGCGNRISYSTWGPSSKELDVNLRLAEQIGAGPMLDELFVWTGEYILRNDHGSPCAIVWPWVCAGGPQYVDPRPQYWDLTDVAEGSYGILQQLDSSLLPTPAETFVPNSNEGFGLALDGKLVVGDLGYATNLRSQYASSLYVDPLDGDNEVYIVMASLAPKAGPQPAAAAFYRIRADGSQPFEFMDGVRELWYSIIPFYDTGLGNSFASFFHNDFVSDPDNVWVPAYQTAQIDSANVGGAVLHLDRQCARQWEWLPAFVQSTDPLQSGYLTSAWSSPTSPPLLVTFDDGDWLLGGGQGVEQRTVSGDPQYVSSLKAKICRCCLPCLKHVGLHIWEKVGGST